MKIVYIANPWFLDFSIEYIKELQANVELHVLLIVNRYKLKSTILNINSFPKNATILDFRELSAEIDNYEAFLPYIEKCKSFKVFMFPDKSLSFSSIQRCYELSKYIDTVDPSIIHFDDLSLQLISLSFFLRSRRMLANVHDPEPHSGEGDWRRTLVRRFFYPKLEGFVLFSNYSKRRFLELYKPNQNVYELSLTPYYFYTQYQSPQNLIEKSVGEVVLLFFGRISKYKGIDELLQAFEKIRIKHKNVSVVIAGKGDYAYQIPTSLQSELGKSVKIINRYITNDELSNLMGLADVVVCPYRDSTQSGVVMTAFAFRKPVIASRVGGLYEGISEGNGIVYSLDEYGGLEKSIDSFLTNSSLDFVSEKLESTSKWNVNKLLRIYSDINNNGKFSSI